jgi:hypothetical protein
MLSCSSAVKPRCRTVMLQDVCTACHRADVCREHGSWVKYLVSRILAICSPDRGRNDLRRFRADKARYTAPGNEHSLPVPEAIDPGRTDTTSQLRWVASVIAHVLCGQK